MSCSNLNLRFLLAPLHISSLALEPMIGHIELALQKLPTGLDETYKQAMIRIENQGGGIRDLARNILSWIIHAKRILFTDELQHAVAVKPGQPELNRKFILNKETIVSICAGLITIDDETNIVRLVHYTAQVYFEQKWEDLLPDAEIDIAKTCITYLSFNVFESGFCQTDVELETRLQLYPLYSYVAQNWGHHCRIFSMLGDRFEGMLDFLKDIRKVSSATQAMLASKGSNGYSQKVPKDMAGLHLAAYFGLLKEVEALLDDEYFPGLEDSYGMTPLSWAARNGHESVVSLLLGANDFEAVSLDKESRTPLSRAAENGHEAVVKLLLREKGVKVDSRDNDFG